MLQKDVEVELRDNAAEQERLLGTSLVYGDTIQVRPGIPIPSLPHLYTSHEQLQHSLTKKYVRVNTTLTSRTENTSLRVELCVENSNGCIFKILPRYKVRSVGDVVSSFIGCSNPKHYLNSTCVFLQVRYNDQVKFESVKTEGQFLHCSVRLCGAVGFHVLEYKSVH